MSPMLPSPSLARLKTMLAVLCAAAGLISLGCAPPGSTDAEGSSEAGTSLQALFDSAWEYSLEESPTFATNVGDNRANDKLTSVAFQDLERRSQQYQVFLDQLSQIDLEALTREERTSAAIFKRQMEDAIAGFEFGAWQIPLNADSGFHVGFSRLPNNVPLQTVIDYENYIKRLEGWTTLVDQQIANMRVGMEGGMVLPKVVLQGYNSTYDTHVVDDATKSVFWAPFADFPDAVPQAHRDRLRTAGQAAIKEHIVPGYRRFSEFMEGEYIPGGTEGIAASDLPQGPEFYAQRVRYFTTLDITAEEVHEIGLREVARIRKDMEELIESTGFEGSFNDFLEFLRTDERFYAETGEELLNYAKVLSKTIDAELPRFFKTLPRLPYGVEPVPDHIAPKYTTGRYVGPPEGSTRPGFYWVNLYDLKSRPLYNIPALTLHEAAPGHHLQISLAKEMESQPNFRRYQYISAFGEGWGLYSELLGEEMGIYTDPYSRFGRMTYEMWRACRLVVDTGMHAMGWTRQQALDYLAANTALPLHEIRTEVDRYISWPGQALAYKMGEIKIRELRAMALERLGPEKFDIREFHDVVLLGGSVPLPVLEANVQEWVNGLLAANS